MRKYTIPTLSVLILACESPDDEMMFETPEEAALPANTAPKASAKLDPALASGPGPSGCPEELCGADRPELPHSTLKLPAGVVPEPPRIERRLRMSEPSDPACDDLNGKDTDDCVSGERLGPALPAFRTSTDGRIALSGDAKTAKVSVSRLDGYPTKPLIRRGPNFEVFSPPKEIFFKEDLEHPRRSPSGDRFFCAADQRPIEVNGRDCYDLTMIEDWRHDGEEYCPKTAGACGQWAAIPIRVCVSNPKTSEAYIDTARATGPWKLSAHYPAGSNEQVVTADGRLVVFRLTGSGGAVGEEEGIGMPFRFRRSDDTIEPERIYSLAYSYSETPCDVQTWLAHDDNVYHSLRPLSSLYYDDRLEGYGLHAYPLRDAYGVPFEEGSLVRGSYPWIDREGNNIVFSTIHPKFEANEVTRYPTAQEYPRASDMENRSPRGFALAGSWTQGKTVMLDNLLNNEDFGFDAGDTRRLGLYRSAGGARIAARVDGNSNRRAYDTNGKRLEHSNTHFIESLQNTFAMHPGLHPVTPRDVVWTFSRGDFLEEVAFDDMLDPHVVLLAPMNAAWINKRDIGPDEGPAAARAGKYRDGFSATNVHDPQEIDLQNAATSPVYPIAKRGWVDGEARVEPIAQGGIEGRGMWLENDASLHFAFPPGQAFPSDRSVYAGVFVDMRADLSGGRQLFSVRGEDALGEKVTWHVLLHPGGVSVQREASGDLEIGSYPVAQDHPYRQPEGSAGGWHHVGLLFQQNREVVVLVDGDPIGARTFSEPLKLGSTAKMTVGGAFGGVAGIRGWVDEARLVVAGVVSQLDAPESIELLCNYARGTMASLPENDPRFPQAERAPLTRARATALGLEVPADERLRCVTDYTADHRVSVAGLGDRSLRGQILNMLSGDGSLHEGMPRPDTRGNAFCRSCHIGSALDGHRPSGLLTAALTAGNVPVEDDPRTQPAQPWARPGARTLAHGVIPMHWITSVHGVPLPSNDKKLASFPVLKWVLREP